MGCGCKKKKPNVVLKPKTNTTNTTNTNNSTPKK